MSSKPRFTIAWLMILIAIFGVLFTLAKLAAVRPEQIAEMLGGSFMSAVIAWLGVAALWRLLGWKSPSRRRPGVVTGVATTALALDVTSWLLIVLFFASQFSGASMSLRSVIGSWVGIAVLGTLAFVMAMTVLKGSPVSHLTNTRFMSNGVRLVACFVAATSCPFLFGLGIGPVMIIIRSLR